MKLFTEPKSSKVTNSILGVWKREIQKDSVARCRYPSCPFTSDQLDKLTEHHTLCEIGIKTKAFACLKCTFQSLVRTEIVEHVLNTHLSEKDAAFELSGSDSSSSESEEEADAFVSDEAAGDGHASGDEPSSSALVTKNTVDKAYGLSSASLLHFKTQTLSPLIPTWLAEL